MSAREPIEGPVLRDSDVVFLVTKRLDEIAKKMTRLEYDDELERMMLDAAEVFEWLEYCITNRVDAVGESE